MLDIAICEDDRFQQGELEEMLYALGKKLGIRLEVSVYERGESLLADFNKGVCYDVIYLDIEMQGMNGIHVAEELRRKDRTVQIIYVTQYDYYIRQSIDTMPSGYIEKPVNPEEFEKTFRTISSWIQEKDAYYRFICDKIPRKICLKNILYFKSSLRQVEIVGREEHYLIYQKLDQIEQELEAENQNQFLRIHQSYLVNYNCIRCFRYNWVELYTGKQLPISRGKREAVEEYLRGTSIYL